MKHVWLIALLLVASCEPVWQRGGVYTLYRSSIVDGVQFVHVATFDASGGEDYNRENCSIAAELFARQPGVSVRYWCERGRAREK
ncbi:hypothetical protein G6M70_09410 [Agrobacterium tumefaciens]|uniref:hypothetical protein n=1 Tax=Agrobacterium tumefaciens TaxID=358 RepID=UPI001573A88C|nr:hypothetical protein [Agrobacterium tumefaciens]NSZ00530.1 hypothetical protein [Agrobacterium tumefaciens]NSZ40183.1 hypothetical protein [Agrobacterium tumefaciens]NTB22806.1 hypothetical protein [Agrobacterium tumefaciens]NTB29316.1 hypothetical protein [Agrobacterium tumefaciens]NTB33188.1 hypothetical protein [Agrobacterium tumefaciens]